MSNPFTGPPLDEASLINTSASEAEIEIESFDIDIASLTDRLVGDDSDIGDSGPQNSSGAANGFELRGINLHSDRPAIPSYLNSRSSVLNSKCTVPEDFYPEVEMGYMPLVSMGGPPGPFGTGGGCPYGQSLGYGFQNAGVGPLGGMNGGAIGMGHSGLGMAPGGMGNFGGMGYSSFGTVPSSMGNLGVGMAPGGMGNLGGMGHFGLGMAAGSMGNLGGMGYLPVQQPGIGTSNTGAAFRGTNVHPSYAGHSGNSNAGAALSSTNNQSNHPSGAGYSGAANAGVQNHLPAARPLPAADELQIVIKLCWLHYGIITVFGDICMCGSKFRSLHGCRSHWRTCQRKIELRSYLPDSIHQRQSIDELRDRLNFKGQARLFWDAQKAGMRRMRFAVYLQIERGVIEWYARRRVPTPQTWNIRAEIENLRRRTFDNG